MNNSNNDSFYNNNINLNNNNLFSNDSNESNLDLDFDKDEDDNDDNNYYENFLNEFKKYYKYKKKNSHSHSQQHENIKHLLQQANNYYLSNNFDQAEDILKKIITISPNLKEPYQILSEIYNEKNDLKKSLFYLMLAADISKGDKDIWLKCCALNKKLKNYQQAEYCITRALKLDKNNLIILYERASLNEELGDVYKAIKIFKNFLNLYPDIEILLHTCNLYVKINKNLECVELIEEFYDKVKNKNNFNNNNNCFSVLINYLYFLYINNNMFEKGIKFYNEKIKKNNKNIDINNNNNFIIKLNLCEIMNIFINNKNNENIYNLIENIVLNFHKLLFEKLDIQETIKNIYLITDKLIYINKIDLIIDFCEKINKEIKEFNKFFEDKELNKITSFIYSKLGEYYYNKNNLEKSKEFFEKSLKEIQSNNNNNNNNNIENTNKNNIEKNINNNIENNNNNNIENNNNNIENNKNFSFSDIDVEDIKVNQNENIKEINNNLQVNNNGNINKYNKIGNYEDKNFIVVKLSEIYDKLGNKEKALNILKEGNNINNNNNNNNEIFNNNEDDNLSNYEIKNEDENNFNEIYNNNFNNNNNNIYEFNNDNNYINNNDNENNINLFNSFIPNIYDMEIKLNKNKKFLSKKTYRLSKKLKRNNNNNNKKNLLLNFQLNEFIHNNIHKLENNNDNNKRENQFSLSEIKKNFDEIHNEINNNKNLYLKLQSSLVLLNSNEINLFIKNTFEPLEKVIIQEIKIEKIKNKLRDYILEKSSIKNFFNQKSLFNFNFNENILTQNENNIDNNINDENINEKNFNENLFVRKSSLKYYLTKKKIVSTNNLVEKNFSSLETIEKYISKENFKKIISQFITHSFNKNKYNECYIILYLLYCSNDFLNIDDFLSFNFQIYFIMLNYKKKYYKYSYELLKKLIIKFNLNKINFFWIQLWNIGKKLNKILLRNYIYKLNINKNFKQQNLLKLFVGLCHYRSNNFETCINIFKELLNEYQNNSYLYFLLSLSILFQLRSRTIKNKNNKIIETFRYFNIYKNLRIKKYPFEVYYNLARIYHFIGLERFALENYKKVIYYLKNENIKQNNNINENKNNYFKNKLFFNCINNVCLIMKKNGNEDKIQDLIFENIVI